MANIFTLENIEDFSEKVNIYELYEKNWFDIYPLHSYNNKTYNNIFVIRNILYIIIFYLYYNDDYLLLFLLKSNILQVTYFPIFTAAIWHRSANNKWYSTLL